MSLREVLLEVRTHQQICDVYKQKEGVLLRELPILSPFLLLVYSPKRSLESLKTEDKNRKFRIMIELIT